MNPTWRIAPVIGVQDVDASAEYYQNKLGFECPAGVFRGSDGEAVYAVLHRDEIDIHIQIRRRNISVSDRPSYECDTYVYVDDADTLHATFVENGARVVRNPTDNNGYSLRDFEVEDLDGNRLVFGSPLTFDADS